MATKVIFDTANKIIKVKPGVTVIDFQVDIYSDGKEDWNTDNNLRKFRFPVRAIGGNPVPGGFTIEPTFFLRYGWQIEPDDADHSLTVVGNVFHDDGLDVIMENPGYSIHVTQLTTLSPDLRSTSGGGSSGDNLYYKVGGAIVKL